MAGKIKHLDRPFEVKSKDDSTGKFTGYASVFGDLDYGRDIVMPGAFSKSLEETAAKGRKIPILWQHRSAMPIGVYDVIREDSKGLYVEGALNQDVQQGREAYSLLKQGALSGISIGYDTIREEYDHSGIVRKLLEVDLAEASLVTFPMLDSARVDSVKSCKTLSDLEDTLRDAGFSRSEAALFIAQCKSVFATQGEPVNAKAREAVEKLRNVVASL